jgi:hypothetical protein
MRMVLALASNPAAKFGLNIASLPIFRALSTPSPLYDRFQNGMQAYHSLAMQIMVTIDTLLGSPIFRVGEGVR